MEPSLTRSTGYEGCCDVNSQRRRRRECARLSRRTLAVPMAHRGGLRDRDRRGLHLHRHHAEDVRVGRDAPGPEGGRRRSWIARRARGFRARPDRARACPDRARACELLGKPEPRSARCGFEESDDESDSCRKVRSAGALPRPVHGGRDQGASDTDQRLCRGDKRGHHLIESRRYRPEDSCRHGELLCRSIGPTCLPARHGRG